MLKFCMSLYCRIRYGKPVIVISGLPRSGTSMMMQMLYAAGLPVITDQLRTADEDNPKGYFEIERIKGLYQENDKSWLVDYKGKAVKIISFLLLHLPAKINYKVIFMERDLDEILASQKKMLQNRGESYDEIEDGSLKAKYRDHLSRVKWFLKCRETFQVLYVPYADVLKEPKNLAETIQDFLGKRLDTEAMTKAVEPELYRNRKG